MSLNLLQLEQSDPYTVLQDFGVFHTKNVTGYQDVVELVTLGYMSAKTKTFKCWVAIT